MTTYIVRFYIDNVNYTEQKFYNLVTAEKAAEEDIKEKRSINAQVYEVKQRYIKEYSL